MRGLLSEVAFHMDAVEALIIVTKNGQHLVFVLEQDINGGAGRDDIDIQSGNRDHPCFIFLFEVLDVFLEKRFLGFIGWFQ